MIDAVDYIDQEVSSFERLYGQYQGELKSTINQLLDSHNAFALLKKAIPLVRDVRTHWSRVLVDPEASRFIIALDEVAAMAQADTGMQLQDPQLTSELNGEAADMFEQAVLDATRLDAMTILDEVRKLRITVAMQTPPNRDQGTTLALLRSEWMSGVNFVRPDRAGRKWNTAQYIRTKYRGILVDAYTESFCYTLISNGIDVAQIQLSDQGTQRFSISGTTPGIPSLSEISSQLMHPNAIRLVSKA